MTVPADHDDDGCDCSRAVDEALAKERHLFCEAEWNQSRNEGQTRHGWDAHLEARP